MQCLKLRYYIYLPKSQNDLHLSQPQYLNGKNFVRQNFSRAKLFGGRNFRYQTKNSSLSPNENFRPIKVKVSLVELQVNLKGQQVVQIKCDYLVWRNFVGRNFRHFSKNLSLSPNEKFRPIKLKVSLVEVQVNIRGKQVIQTNYDYLVGRNLVGRNFRRAKFSSV